jgi:DNA-binding beta-propeller fold protein YncE
MAAMRRWSGPLFLSLTVPGLLAGCGGAADSGAAADPSSGSITASSSDPAYVAARVSTGHKPCGVLGVGGKVWVSNYGDNTLVTVDPSTGQVGPPTRTGGAPCGLAQGAGSIWVEDFGSDQVTRVSATDGSVQATYDVGDQPYDVTFADGAAWVTNYGDGTVSRIDAGTGAQTRIKTGGTPIGIAPAGGKVWVGLGSDGIAAIDTATGTVVATIAGDQAGWTAYDDSHVWVNVGATVAQIDPATATVTRTVAVGTRPEDGTVADGRVWVGDGSGDLYWFPVDGEATQARSAPSSVQNPFVAAELDGQLWLVDFQGTDVVRVDPAQLG